MYSSVNLWFFLLILSLKYSSGNKCVKSDFEFQYTECDKTGHRWLVSVPKLNKSCDTTSDFNIPKPARNCGQPCQPGTYLDLESQDCKDCPSGTYSQGDTIEINNWQNLPPGFRTLSIDVRGRECKNEEWIPKVDFLSARVQQCESFLTFSASLYKAGELRFDYQMPEEGTIFLVKVVHDECTSKLDDRDDTVKFMDSTAASAWNRKRIALKKGRNDITWTVSGMESDRSTVKINNLMITNSIFSTQCTNCSAGYFSSTKSSVCTPCGMNKFSDLSGSDQCKDCPLEKYSLPGSKLCTVRLSCTKSDYSYKWTECDLQNQRKQIYSWIIPKLCSETLANAVKLPTDSQSFLCEPCPSGTFLNISTKQCSFCPAGTMSSKAGEKCVQCAHNTKPVSTIFYDKWFHPLPNLTVLCIKKLMVSCNVEDSWVFNGDRLESSMVSDTHFLQLLFQTSDTVQTSNTVSQFSFEFSLDCVGYCVLHLFLKRDKFAATRVNTWVNTTSRTEARHLVPFNTSGKFVWYFAHHSDLWSANKSTDHVKIFSIKMTDLKDVGAIDCRSCDPKYLSNGCLDCDKGKYFSKDKQRCEFCPAGHILKSYPSQSVADCVSCGPGLLSVDGTTCLPNMTYTSLARNVYDLSKLKGHHLLKGIKLFNNRGQEYVHVFNVTLFSDRSQDLSFCRNNISSPDGVVEVTSPLCRMTIVADKSQNNTLFSIQTTSLAEVYQKIEQSNISTDYWKRMNDSLMKNGFDGDSSGVDLHVHLFSVRKTYVCTNGRETTVTLRCDNKLTESQLMLPSKCPMETCDGCNFHFLLKSQFACPYCRLEDFTVITEECVGGQQKRHFQAPSYCILKPGWKSTENIKCPLVTMRTAVVVIPTIFILLFLIGLVVYCYKKNQKLQYKYMRLIGGNDDNEHVLSGVESCGMNDDDEDEDDVKIKTNSKSGKIFAKFNKPNRNRRDENDMETVNLNDNPEFDI